MQDVFVRLKTALADRYAIQEELGAGGMATVYLAEDLKHHRKVAVKVLRPELAAVLGAERFLKEIEVTANLQHPHILPLFDSGEADSFLYYVMPYVEGESLREKLNREKQLGVDETVKIAEGVAAALDYAHRQGVIHRDIKPENILIHDGRPVVADFGIALAVTAVGGTRLTETGLSLGTPQYMSPEQATGERELTATSDVYSLGAVVYEMLVGDPPHTGSTVQAIVAKVVSAEPQPISDVRHAVPLNVQAAVQKALAKVPADRFHDTAAFAAALTDEQFAVRAESVGGSLARRSRAFSAFAAMLAYLAGAFVVFQAVEVVAEPWSISPALQRTIHILLLVGFFVALALAWYHGERGRQRVTGPELLMIAFVLVVGGAGVWMVGGAERAAEPTELARFAALDDDRPTIAVLPLTNLSSDPENSYFAAGIHEELLRRLSLVRGLAVISRTSVLQYAGAAMGIPEIAAELGARYIVEGSVQKDAGRVRIQVQLIDATADRHLWAQRYDRTVEDLFEVQSEVAQAIAGELRAAVTPEERERIEAAPTQDPIAYDLYLRATELNGFIQEEYDTKLDLLRGATRLDPAFALAHAMLAGTFYGGMVSYGYPPFDSAVARADLAVELDPNLPTALAIKGILLTATDQDEAAQAVLQRALTLDPSNSDAWSALSNTGWKTGEPVTGALAGRRGLTIEPNSTSLKWNLGVCLMYVGMYDEAIQWFQSALDVNPSHSYALFSIAVASGLAGDHEAARGYASQLRETAADFIYHPYWAALIDIFVGDLQAAEAMLSQAVASSPDMSINGTPSAQALQGWLMARSGSPEGREQLESLRRIREEELEAGRLSYFRANDLALIASVLGEEDEQLRWFLEAARLDRQNQQAYQYWLHYFPFFEGIRGHPEYQSWLDEEEQRKAAQRRELAAMGPWSPEAVLGGGGR